MLKRKMGKQKFIITIFILSPMICCFGAAQDANDSLVYQIGFEQELTTYRWLSQIYFQRILLNHMMLRAIENFGSSLIRFSSSDHKWKDDQQFTLEFQIPLSERWKFNWAAAANRFRDRLSGFVSDFNTNWSTAGLKFQWDRNYELSSAIGYKYDDRQIRQDRGLTHQLFILVDSLEIQNYINHIHFFSKGDDYSRRQNFDAEFKYQVTRHFQEGAFDSLAIFWDKKRRDNYDQFILNQILIESFKENNKGIANYLRYTPFSSIHLKFRTLLHARETSVGKYLSKNDEERRSRNDFQFENEISLLIQNRLAYITVALHYETDEQKNAIPDSIRAKKFSKFYYYISPDFESSRLTLLSRIQVRLSRADSLQLYGSISRYRYDTPKNNPDDRDELRWNFAVNETHYFAPHLKLITNGNVILNHLVYIFGERSANNNWMRIFHLFPQIVYQPNRNFSVAHDFEVYANYVDYDFEFGKSSADLKSFVYRKFSLNQELKTRITQRTQVVMSNKIELEENGKLDWERWTEFLLMNRETYWLRVSLNFQPNRTTLIAPGFLYSKRVERNQHGLFRANDASGITGTIISMGPTLKLSYHPHPKLFVSFEGMRRAIMVGRSQKSYFNNFNFMLNWYK